MSIPNKNIDSKINIPFFYQSNISKKNPFITLEESQHITKVLRYKIGDCICVTNGNGEIYTGLLTSVSLQKCTIKIIDTLVSLQKKYTIHIAVAPTKNMSRLEWFVEKSIEIGINEFSFIQCTNSERKSINNERLKKKAISALKQSKQAWLPTINPIIPFRSILDADGEKFIAHKNNSHPLLLKDAIKPKSNYVILIGPEGGFTENELSIAKKNGFKSIVLSPNRLRTETAGIVACHICNFIN